MGANSFPLGVHHAALISPDNSYFCPQALVVDWDGLEEQVATRQVEVDCNLVNTAESSFFAAKEVPSGLITMAIDGQAYVVIKPDQDSFEDQVGLSESASVQVLNAWQDQVKNWILEPAYVVMAKLQLVAIHLLYCSSLLLFQDPFAGGPFTDSVANLAQASSGWSLQTTDLASTQSLAYFAKASEKSVKQYHFVGHFAL